jgi:hypothetical protein
VRDSGWHGFRHRGTVFDVRLRRRANQTTGTVILLASSVQRRFLRLLAAQDALEKPYGSHMQRSERACVTLKRYSSSV